MSHAWCIARRELGAMFRLPAGWVIIALYTFLCGAVFGLMILAPGNPASLREFFNLSGWLLLPVVPAISMRLISEELRSGTIEPLMTAPVSDASVVLGKFTGGCVFLLAMLVPTLAYVGVLMSVSDPRPDPGPVVAGYASLVLQGAMYLALGTLASALTANQTLAFLLTLFSMLALLMLSAVSLDRAPELVRTVASALSVDARVRDFARGVIDTGHVIFFLGGATFFLTLAVVALQSRRWR